MTSEERHEARYRRRKRKRQMKRWMRSQAVGTLEEVFNYRDMFYWGKKCCNGVRWKQSTQNFELHLLSGTAKRRRLILEGKWKPRKCAHFTLHERGKVRPIDAPHTDDRLRALADLIVTESPCTVPGRGMPLGVEPSQQEMVSLPSDIDNFIKCQLGIHCAGHYMDDYYIILPDVEELKRIARIIIKRFEMAGILVNKRKCKIIPLTKPFRFCKARFTLTETGKIKVNGCRDGVKRARRKLKLFHRQFLEGKKTLQEIDQYMESQTSYYRTFNDHGRLLKLRRMHYAIFNKYREAAPLKMAG